MRASLWLATIVALTANALSILQPDQHLLSDSTSTHRCLIELEPGNTTWVTEDQKWELKRQGVNFMDITFTPDLSSWASAKQNKKKAVAFPKKPVFKEALIPLMRNLSKELLEQHLKNFTSFYTRYYKSEYGAESAAWLLDQVNQTLNEANAGQYGASVKFFQHPWGQNSIIATIPGRSEKTIVIGAHQDSINLFLPSILPAPGADDDGSGTVTILEALRVLLRSQDISRGNASNTIEFHWYSAEEGGLLGSQAIFSAYEKAGKDVKAMFQQDMTGYIHNTIAAGKKESVGVITDYVNPELTEFIKEVVTEYCNIPYVLTKCGYACSDHASASKAGYPAAFVIESDFQYFDPNIHTTEDKIKYLNFDHMLQHARLTLGLTYELAFAKFE